MSVTIQTDHWGAQPACLDGALPATAWDVGNPRSADAKRACRACPVLSDCAAWAAVERPSRVICAGRRWDLGVGACVACGTDTVLNGARRAFTFCSPACAHSTLCGTRSGYDWHHRHGESACEPCKATQRTGWEPLLPVIGEHMSCDECKVGFPVTRAGQRFCGTPCRVVFHNRLKRARR